MKLRLTQQPQDKVKWLGIFDAKTDLLIQYNYGTGILVDGRRAVQVFQVIFFNMGLRKKLDKLEM